MDDTDTEEWDDAERAPEIPDTTPEGLATDTELHLSPPPNLAIEGTAGAKE